MSTPVVRIAAGEVPYWDSPYVIWLILGGWALVGVLVAIVCKSWFTKEMSDDKAAPAT